MRSVLAFCGMLALAVPAWAQNTVPAQQPFAQQPAVGTSVPSIQPSGAAGVTTSSTGVQQGTTGNTVFRGDAVTAQPPPTGSSSGTTYYYYPAGSTGVMYGTAAPTRIYYYPAGSTPVYTNTGQTYYYTQVRRGFPFGLFRRRYMQPMAPAYTTAYTATPTYYYSSPGYYYAPTTYYTAPAGATGSSSIASGTTPATSSPVYNPTGYTVPNPNVPAGTPSASVATPSGGTIPTQSIPSPPPVNPR